MPRKSKEIVYYYRGMQDGTRVYSATGLTGGELQPYMSRRQCQKDAKAQGAAAIFVNERLEHALDFVLRQP